MPFNPYLGRVEVLGRTVSAIVFTEPGNEQTVLKGLSVWIDGIEHDRRPLIEDGMIEREAAVYETIGDHPFIIKSFRLETVDPATKASALRLERAPLGCLRTFIMEAPPEKVPTLATRLRIAADFAEGVSHLYSKRIIWADLSARNVLLFDNYQIKLSDFGGSGNLETDDDSMVAYEARYDPPVKFTHGEISMMAREIFALGTAVCEITEWRVPYGTSRDDEEELNPRMRRGELPDLSPDNPAKQVIMKCWTEYPSVSESWDEYTLASEVCQSLRQLTDRDRVREG